MTRDEDLVADAVDFDDHVIGSARDHRPAYRSYHAVPQRGRVEARGGHLLPGPLSCALFSFAPPAGGNPPRARGTPPPSPPPPPPMSPPPHRPRNARRGRGSTPWP